LLIALFVSSIGCSSHHKLKPWNPELPKIRAQSCQAKFSGQFPDASEVMRIRGTIDATFSGKRSSASIVVFDFFKNPLIRITALGKKISYTPKQHNSEYFLRLFSKNWWDPLSFMLGAPERHNSASILADSENIPVKFIDSEMEISCTRDLEAKEAKCAWISRKFNAKLDFSLITCRSLL
jgi:hypothetical protein